MYPILVYVPLCENAIMSTTRVPNHSLPKHIIKMPAFYFFFFLYISLLSILFSPSLSPTLRSPPLRLITSNTFPSLWGGLHFPSLLRPSSPLSSTAQSFVVLLSLHTADINHKLIMLCRKMDKERFFFFHIKGKEICLKQRIVWGKTVSIKTHTQGDTACV